MRSTTGPRAVLAAALLTAALAACGGGGPERSSEAEFLHGAGGVHERVGSILLRDVSVDEPDDGVYAAGDVARLRVVLFNEGERDDRLVGVSSPAAADARLLVDADCDGTAEQLGAVPLPVVPVGEGLVSTDGPEPFYRVDLLLDEQVRSGESLAVTFTFAEAGATTVQVPVELAGEENRGDDAACEPVL